jgi:hypothetical protein
LTLSLNSRALIIEYRWYFLPMPFAIYYNVNKLLSHNVSLGVIFNAFALLFLSSICLFA